MIESTLFSELKQLCCEINPDVSVKMSDVSEHSEFDYPKEKKKKRKSAVNGGYIIKCLLTELGPYAMTSCQIFSRLARPNSVNKYIVFVKAFFTFTEYGFIF